MSIQRTDAKLEISNQRQNDMRQKQTQFATQIQVGTVENHGNTEITETVIFIKGRDFARMPCFLLNCRGFTFFYKNMLFLISIS